MVTPRGKTERERGGRCCQATKGWGEIPAHSGQDRLSPARLRRRRPTKAQRRAHKVTPGSGSGADPARLALEGPEVQIVTLGNSLRGREASLRPHFGRTSAALRPHYFGRTSGHTIQYNTIQYNTICLKNSKAGLDVT